MAYETRIKVRFYELDPYNHLNHSAYIQYFETARIELLQDSGYDLVGMMETGMMIVVTDIQTRFFASAVTGDELLVETEVLEFKRVTSTWRQRLFRGEELIASQDLRAALLDLEGRPMRFPPEMIDALEPYRGER